MSNKYVSWNNSLTFTYTEQAGWIPVPPSRSQWEHQQRIEKAKRDAEAKTFIPEDWS